jgi:hypothetical protein
MKIYVASSWRNERQPAVVAALWGSGHKVYDFRNPPGLLGFGWEQVAHNGEREADGSVSAAVWRRLVDDPIGRKGYLADLLALRAADVVVYVLPCGRSASWELGYAMALGKPAFLFWEGTHEPELMFRDARVVTGLPELLLALEDL